MQLEDNRPMREVCFTASEYRLMLDAITYAVKHHADALQEVYRDWLPNITLQSLHESRLLRYRLLAEKLSRLVD